MKAVITGCGAIASRWARSLLSDGRIGITALVDPDQQAAQARAARYGLSPAVAMTLPEVLAQAEADVVVNLTPPELHYPVSRSALAQGLHVLTEKPLALNLPDALDLVHLARERGLLLAVMHNRGADPDFLTFADTVRSGGRAPSAERRAPSAERRHRRHPGLVTLPGLPRRPAPARHHGPRRARLRPGPRADHRAAHRGHLHRDGDRLPRGPQLDRRDHRPLRRRLPVHLPRRVHRRPGPADRRRGRLAGGEPGLRRPVGPGPPPLAASQAAGALAGSGGRCALHPIARGAHRLRCRSLRSLPSRGPRQRLGYSFAWCRRMLSATGETRITDGGSKAGHCVIS
ncbi:Gfo/Idh/MocA family protein [Kitasatospora sp. NPDC057542]|uniref:Gfo/Idh/MocA family protein n=1 Tax=Kitasatospora sp. NPDC057542 TaxID=3346162 RepID=UPI00367433FF